MRRSQPLHLIFWTSHMLEDMCSDARCVVLFLGEAMTLEGRLLVLQ